MGTTTDLTILDEIGIMILRIDVLLKKEIPKKTKKTLFDMQKRLIELNTGNETLGGEEINGLRKKLMIVKNECQ